MAKFTTCQCNNCKGKLEFEAASLTPETCCVVCPHCGGHTILRLPTLLQRLSFWKNKASDLSRDLAIGLGIPHGCIFFVFLFWLVVSLVVSFGATVSAISEEGEKFFVPSALIPHLITIPFLAAFVSLFVSLFGFFGVIIYFLPAQIAWRKRKKNKQAILILNMLAGWTVAGWVAALVWAAMED